MPLPHLDPDNTARYKVFYTVSAYQHTSEVRVGIVSPSAFGTAFGTFLGDLAPNLYATTIDSVEYAGAGTTVFFPVTTGIEGITYGSGSAVVPGENAYFYDFSGRTSGGRRMRAFQYGAKTLGGDYRFAAGEDTDLDAALAVIVGEASMWLGIDGVKPVMKSYINAGVNSYWQRKVRP